MIKNGKWRCQVCEFDNIDDLTSCEMCESPHKKDMKPIEGIEQQIHFEKEAGIICPNKSCSHYNSLSSDTCSKCQRSLFGQHSTIDEKGGKTKSALKHCFKCTFQNDTLNVTCVNCDTDLFQKKIPMHSIMPHGGFMGRKNLQHEFYCQDCGGKMKIMIAMRMSMGLPIGYDDYMCPKCAKSDLSSLGKLCVFCDQHLTQQETEFHNDVCIPRASFYNRQGNPTFERCSSLQVQTAHHMHKKYQAHHEQNKSLLLYRVKKLGYKQKDLENLHHYIMHYAPIIIHFRVQNFQFYTKDTHYRNCFEVAKRNCPSRVKWEDRMFDNKHHSASHYERVKYGTMNFTNDPRGVNACVGYGQSYFLLKSHVRDRCTITDMDSASSAATIGTFRFIFHVLAKLSDAQLKAAFEGSRGKEMLSNVISVYKQIQIHGPVEFSKDIQRVYLCRQEFLASSQTYEKLVKEFCEKNQLDHEFFDRKDPHGSAHMANKVVSAPQRVLGKDVKQLNLDEQEVERARGIPYSPFGFAFYPPKIAKPIKKAPHKK